MTKHKQTLMRAIVAHKERYKLTQVETAETIGIDQPTLSRAIHGVRVPMVQTLIGWVERLGYDVEIRVVENDKDWFEMRCDNCGDYWKIKSSNVSDEDVYQCDCGCTVEVSSDEGGAWCNTYNQEGDEI